MDNQVRLQLFAMAYNMGNFLKRLALSNKIKDWLLRTMREKLVKIGAKVVSHVRYVTFQMAEVAVPKVLFREIRLQYAFLSFIVRQGVCKSIQRSNQNDQFLI